MNAQITLTMGFIACGSLLGAVESANCAEEDHRTEISFVGEKLAVDIELEGLWRVQAGDDYGGWVIAQRGDLRTATRAPRMRTIRITGREFPDAEEMKSRKQAAKFDWYVAIMRYTRDWGWGGRTGSECSSPGPRNWMWLGTGFTRIGRN